MNDFKVLKRLKEYMNNTPLDQIEKDWKDCEMWDDVMPHIDDFLSQMQANEDESESKGCHIDGVSGSAFCEHYFEPTVNHGKVYKICLKCGLKVADR